MSQRVKSVLLVVALPMLLGAVGSRVSDDGSGIAVDAAPVEFVSVSWDHHAATAEALRALSAFVATSTTTTVARQAVNPVSIDVDDSVWDRLAVCEAGGVWSRNTGNGFGGGLQFMHQRSYSTWLSFGGGEFAHDPWDATREQQIVVAERVLSSSGWGAWPGCSARLGLR